MARFLFVLLLLCAAPALAEYAGTLVFRNGAAEKTVAGVPRFADFPAAKDSGRRAKDIDFKSNKRARLYRTWLRNGLKDGPDYNGHYKVVTAGCGTGCQYNFILDVTTGKVLADFYTSMGTLYKKDSALLVKDLWEDGAVDLDYYALSEAPVEFFAVKKGRFVSLKKIDTKRLRESLGD